MGWDGASLSVGSKEGGGQWPLDILLPRAGAAGPRHADRGWVGTSLLPRSTGWEGQGVLGPARLPPYGTGTRDKLETSNPLGQADLMDPKAHPGCGWDGWGSSTRSSPPAPMHTCAPASRKQNSRRNEEEEAQGVGKGPSRWPWLPPRVPLQELPRSAGKSP